MRIELRADEREATKNVRAVSRQLATVYIVEGIANSSRRGRKTSGSLFGLRKEKEKERQRLTLGGLLRVRVITCLRERAVARTVHEEHGIAPGCSPDPASSRVYENVGVAAPDSWERPRGNTVDGIARNHRIAIGIAGIFLRKLLRSKALSRALNFRRSP